MHKVIILLRECAESEERRNDILNAMLGNDMDKVRNLLRETVKKAIERKQKEGNFLNL